MSQVLLYLVGSLSLIGAYALLGIGITVIYQASRVLNLAHGAMAVAGAYAAYQLVRWHVPVFAAVLGGVALGAVFALAVERFLVRRLRAAGPTTQTVSTVAVLALTIAVATHIYGSLPVTPPQVLPGKALHIGHGSVAWNALGVFPLALVAGGLVFALLQFTDMGLAMRGAAQNRRGAALRGVNPDRTASLAWAIGGALAALTGIVVAAHTELDPFTVSLGVLPAFVAALIGGLESLPGVCIGAVIVGVVQGFVQILGSVPVVGSLVQGQGTPELVVGVIALVVMALRGSRLSVGDVRGDQL